MQRYGVFSKRPNFFTEKLAITRKHLVAPDPARLQGDKAKARRGSFSAARLYEGGMGFGAYQPKYLVRMLILSASRNRRSARSLIWRTRSRVRLRLLATSSAVISLRPMPKSIFST